MKKEKIPKYINTKSKVIDDNTTLCKLFKNGKRKWKIWGVKVLMNVSTLKT